MERPLRRQRRWNVLILIVAAAVTIGTWAVAGEPADFPGTVLSVDVAGGKLAVKKDGGGTRFTFVVTGKTRFQGHGLAGLKDVKKDDHLLVQYQVESGKYLAVTITAKAK